VRRLLDTDTIVFLRSLLTVRENPYVWFAARREMRRGQPLVRLVIWLVILALITGGALAIGLRWRSFLALFPVPLGPGRFACAVLMTVEFWTVVLAASARRYGLRQAELANAGDEYRLVPLRPIINAGMRNTYPLAVALLMTACAFPLHLVSFWGGDGRPGEVLLAHVFLLVACVGAAERPSSLHPMQRDANTSKAQRRRMVGVMAALGNVAMQFVARTISGPSSAGIFFWALLFPYLIPGALVVPREFWAIWLPIAVPALVAWIPTITLTARRAARSNDRRAETIFVRPWSLGGLGTVFGLTVAAGFLWPWVANGAIASMVGASSPDPTRSAEALFAVLMAAWAGLIAGPHLLWSASVSWGALRSPDEVTDTPTRRQMVRRELAWGLEAAASAYVPCLAFALAISVGGLAPDSLGTYVPPTVVAATVLLSCWSLGRLGRIHRDRGMRVGWLIGWRMVGVACLIGGLFAPAPYGRYLLAVVPLGAAVSIAPGVVGGISGLAMGSIRADVPTLALAAGAQLAVACVALGAVLYSRRATAAAPRPRRLRTVPTSILYRRDAYVHRITANPVAVRLLRSRRHNESLHGMFSLFATLSLLAWATWSVCLYLKMTGASPSSVTGWLAECPAPLVALPAVVLLGVSIGQAGSIAGLGLRMERATGALAVTCLTPLRTTTLFLGYVTAPLLGTVARLLGFLPCLPLAFIGVDPGTALLVAGIASAALIYFMALVQSVAILNSMPGAGSYGVTDSWGRFLWNLTCGLPIMGLVGGAVIAGTSAGGGPEGPIVGLAIALAQPVIGYAVAWSRFRRMRESAIPDSPEPEAFTAGRAPVGA
jgi:hypothetical protein